MANNCYNTIEIFGNTAVVAQVHEWKKLLDSYSPTKEDPYCARAIKEVFYPNTPIDQWPEYGSKWVYQDKESIDSPDNGFGLRSAWSSPDELEKHLACLLFEVDKNVIVRNSYNVDDGSLGISYSTPVNDTDAYRQEAFVECDYSDFEEPDEAEEDADDRLLEAEREMLTDYFFDDMPHLAVVFKSNFPNLKIDWSDYE